MAETLNSAISLTLGNVPDIKEGAPEEVYEALLSIHQAIEILVDYYDEVGGIYVTIGDAQTITGAKTFEATITLADGINLTLNTATGTKIGTATDQKIGLWDATPVVQPASANQAALTNNTGGSYDGTLAAIVGSGADANINNNFTDIHTLLNEIRTALVATGNIKGSA